MIDLTLDSILIPDITGYMPPFGTKVARTAVNKGGLSTQEVSNNIIASFVKMRGIVVATSDTTSRIEYDAKIIIEAAEAITLTLGNATYKGCRLSIVNSTAATHRLSCTSVSTNAPRILPNANVEVMWNGTAWQAAAGVNVGQTYEQKPQTDSPFDIFPCSDWTEMVATNGAFFRSASAPATLYSLDGERFFRDSELTHPVDFTGMFGEDGNQATAVDSGSTVTNSKGQTVRIYTGSWTEGNADAYIDKSGDLTAQKAQLPSITGSVTMTYSGSSYGVFSGAFYKISQLYSKTRGSGTDGEMFAGNTGFDSSKAGASKDVNGNNVYADNGEVRPANLTVRVWRRTA